MYPYLVSHALDHVWCSPTQDNQLMFAPKRITPTRGALNHATVLGDTLELPVKKTPVHLFQIGQMDPFTIGLLRQVPHWRTQRWFKFSDAVNHANLEVTIYNGNGVNLPRNDCYYIFLDDRALVFAVPTPKNFPVNLETEAVYFRFYTNAYYHRNSPVARSLSCGKFEPTTNDDILAMEQVLATKRALPGGLRTYLNGLLTDRAELGNVKLGDYVEWVQDSSVKRVVEWKLSDLHQFRSPLDQAYKYLLHYQGAGDPTIDFEDDIDIHVIIKLPQQFSKGVYYNRNHASQHRMVTHRDYSIATESVTSLKDNLARVLGLIIPNADNIYVQATVRRGGIERPLVMDSNRLFELYKLDEVSRLRALNGSAANVPEWNCAMLEQSLYNKVMRSRRQDVTLEMVQGAYGYNACSVILAQTPTKTVSRSGNQIADIPYGLQQGSTIYEFDANGLLLGFRAHVNDNEYEAVSPDCRLVEGVLGIPSITTDSVHGATNIPLPTHGNSYRVYRCFLVAEIPDRQWEDITGTSEYKVVNNQVVWEGPDNGQWLMVRGDGNLLAYDYTLRQNDGLINFTIMENPTGNPIDEMEPLQVPLAQLDIWMNRRKLIEGLDYFVQFPLVVVTNKKYLNQPVDSADQHFHIRMMGLPDKGMKLDAIEDSGWVLNGSLSNNSRFDLRDDKVLQINVGGCIYHREDLKFAEQRPGSQLLNSLNGVPYQIKDLIVPMQSFVAENTYTLRAKAQGIDKRVSDYMTLKFGEMESTALSAIAARYPLVSPFFSHLVHLLRLRLISLPGDRLCTTMEVMNICQTHERLLAFDPLKDTVLSNSAFVYILPHANDTPYTLDFLSYRFLKQVADLYGQGKIEISEYLTITSA